jgi:hypothetical protein
MSGSDWVNPARDLAAASGPRLAFLIGTPLAWAVLLLFHPNAGAGTYEALTGQATSWLVVHLGTFVFLGLMAGVLYLLIRDLDGAAARISRLAIGLFLLFYVAGEAILGVATGVLVQYTDGLPADQGAAAAGAVQALWSNFISDDRLYGRSVRVAGVGRGHAGPRGRRSLR